MLRLLFAVLAVTGCATIMPPRDIGPLSPATVKDFGCDSATVEMEWSKNRFKPVGTGGSLCTLFSRWGPTLNYTNTNVAGTQMMTFSYSLPTRAYIATFVYRAGQDWVLQSETVINH